MILRLDPMMVLDRRIGQEGGCRGWQRRRWWIVSYRRGRGKEGASEEVDEAKGVAIGLRRAAYVFEIYL